MKFRKVNCETCESAERASEPASRSFSRRSFCRSASTHGDFHGSAGRIETSLLSNEVCRRRGAHRLGTVTTPGTVRRLSSTTTTTTTFPERNYGAVRCVHPAALKVDLRTMREHERTVCAIHGQFCNSMRIRLTLYTSLATRFTFNSNRATFL